MSCIGIKSCHSPRAIICQINFKAMNSLTVSMTGFSGDPREQQYRLMLNKLNIRYAPTLVEATSALIVKQAITEKYKIAKVYEKPIPCIKIDWLINSIQNNALLDPLQFKIADVFYGVNLHLMASPASARMKAAIENNGGSCKVIDPLQLKQDIKNEQIRLLVIVPQRLSYVRAFFDTISFAVVGIDWIIDSINANMCKYPYDYAYNQQELGRNDTLHHYKKMRNKLGTALQTFKCQQATILDNTIIYLGDHMNSEAAKVLKKLIVANGGFYLQEMNPAATHILIEPVEHSQYLSYCTYGALTHVLRIEWLIDSVYFNRRMLESDYVIRSFKAFKCNSDSTQSRSISSFTDGPYSLKNTQNSIKKTISMPSPELQPTKKQKFDSKIFKGCNFYVESSHRNEQQLKNALAQISRNGGNNYRSRRDIEKGLCYYVLKDGRESSELIKALKMQVEQRKTLIQPVSYRWVKQCLAKGRILDLFSTDSYIHKPLPLKLPLHGFHRFIFASLMLDAVLKARLKELYNVLGSIKNTPNISEVTHCLCGEGYASTAKYKQMREENKAVIFIDWKWLIECVNSGTIVDAKQYLVESAE